MKKIIVYICFAGIVCSTAAQELKTIKLNPPDITRALVAGSQEEFAKAPVLCVLVSDISRFTRGEESSQLVWAAEDAGIVSQNISIFCASVGFATRPRASMDQEKLRLIFNGMGRVLALP